MVSDRFNGSDGANSIIQPSIFRKNCDILGLTFYTGKVYTIYLIDLEVFS